MTTAIERRVRVIPWDDAVFVRAYETARDQARSEGLTINGPKACARVQELIRAAGFPDARVDCERTVAEAMAHIAAWTVHRDGRPAEEARAGAIG